jgi:alpha-beta hydrolase superfamily lysophospholipase
MIPQIFQHAAEFDLPILIMHGTADRLAYVRGSQEFARLTSCDCTLKLWDGLYHEVHNEPEKEDVLNSMTDWLDSKSGLPLDKLDPSWENSAGESLSFRGDGNG